MAACATGLLGSDETPPYRYIELFEINVAEGVGEGIVVGEVMQQVCAHYRERTDKFHPERSGSHADAMDKIPIAA